jgi:hypothetical protein
MKEVTRQRIKEVIRLMNERKDYHYQLKELAYQFDLTVVRTISGKRCPSDVVRAVINFKSFSDIKAAAELSGLKIQALCRKAGYENWYRNDIEVTDALPNPLPSMPDNKDISFYRDGYYYTIGLIKK